jgi:tetratricopeptide (TPR) repeat protein
MKNKTQKQIPLLIALFSVIIMITGCKSKDTNMPVTTRSEKAKSLFLEARVQMFENNPKMYTDLLKQALDLDKDFALANLYYGYSGLGSIDREKFLNAAYDKISTVSETEKHLILAFIAYSKGIQDSVIKEMKKAIELSPNDKYLALTLANVFDSYGKYEDALVYARKSYESDTLFSNAVNYQGYLLWRLKKADEAEKMYKKSIEMNPANSAFYNNYGQLLRGKGKLDEAIAMHKKALEIRQDYLSYLFLGHCYVAKNDYPAARENYLKAFDVSVNNGQKNFCLESVGSTYLYEGNLPDALFAFDKRADFNKKLGKMDVEIIQSLIYKIISCQIYKDFVNSEKYITQVKDLVSSLELTETDRSNYKKYSILLDGFQNAYSGNNKEAEKYLAQFEKQLNGTEKNAYSNDINEIRGIVESNKGNYDAAIALLEKSSTYAQYYTGLIYEKTGKAEKAKEIFSNIAGNNLTSFDLAVVKPFAKKKLAELTKK